MTDQPISLPALLLIYLCGISILLFFLPAVILEADMRDVAGRIIELKGDSVFVEYALPNGERFLEDARIEYEADGPLYVGDSLEIEYSAMDPSYAFVVPV